MSHYQNEGEVALEAVIASHKNKLQDPSLYLNRELALLEFNRRVLAQARDPHTPLLERLRFLSICSTNLDEFFEIRVAGLHEQVELDVQAQGPDGLSPRETLRRVSVIAQELIKEQYRVLNKELLPALESEGIRLLKRSSWDKPQQKWIRAYFDEQVLPVLTPIALDPAHPFPNVLNKSLTFIVKLVGADAFGRETGFAVVQVPRCLPRVLRVPFETGHDFVMLSSVIHAHMGRLFPGMKVVSCHQFRITRNSDLWVHEEDIDDLLQALKGELPQRRYGQSVRLEVADNCPDEIADFLLARVDLTRQDLYQVNGPVNLHRLAAIIDEVDRTELMYPPFNPGLSERLRNAGDIFEVIQRQDVLIHCPFQTFAPVVELLKTAASDPGVLAIKQTLYRTGARSPIVDALESAARAGKDVTVLVELRARFDEADNIKLATRLQAAGANVVYGVVGYKTHSKMLMIVRREGSQIRRYVHLGTGNYHTRTARAYTDISMMTANKQIAQDVHELFMQLTGLGKVVQLNKLLQSPFTLHPRILELINQERKAAEKGKKARIIAKMNSLTDASVIQALYAASQAGVQIDLVIRGVCRLRPGIPGVSENIQVRSIVGRYLEHSRVFYFYAGGKELVYGSSADWMERNLYKRVEACFPIEDPELKARVIHECLQVYLEDTAQTWILNPDGSYTQPGEDDGNSAQERLQAELGG